MQSASEQFRSEGGDRRKGLVERAHREANWLGEQLPVLADRSKPFLRLHDRRW